MITLDSDHLLRLRAFVRKWDASRSVTHLPGGLVTRARGRGLEVADIRAFAHGDDPRHIDRNATARTGSLQVRNFHAERDRTTLLIADFRPSMLWGTRRTLRSIAAAEALCLVGWRAVGDGGRVGLIAVSACAPVFVSARGRDRGMVAIIGGMVRAHEAALSNPDQSDPPLADALEFADRVAPRGADVVVATALDAPGSVFEEAAKALRRRTTLSIHRIVDAFETDPPRGRFRFRTASGRSGIASAPSAKLAPDPLGLVTKSYRVAETPEAQSTYE